jgi:hypothetical protein
VKLRTVAVLGALGWCYAKAPRDPQEWPAFAGEQFAILREQVAEAVEAGKRAGDRRIEQLDREVAEAFDHAPTERP